MTAKTVGSNTQATEPLDHQNCKWLPVLSFLACFKGKTGELRNALYIKLSYKIRKKSGVSYLLWP